MFDTTEIYFIPVAMRSGEHGCIFLFCTAYIPLSCLSILCFYIVSCLSYDMSGMPLNVIWMLHFVVKILDLFVLKIFSNIATYSKLYLLTNSCLSRRRILEWNSCFCICFRPSAKIMWFLTKILEITCKELL